MNLSDTNQITKWYVQICNIKKNAIFFSYLCKCTKINWKDKRQVNDYFQERGLLQYVMVRGSFVYFVMAESFTIRM